MALQIRKAFYDTTRKDNPERVKLPGNLSEFLPSRQVKRDGTGYAPPQTHDVGQASSTITDADRDANDLMTVTRAETRRKAKRLGIHKETVDFDVAKTEAASQLIDVEGDVLWFQRSTNATDVLKVRIDHEKNPFLEFLPGQGISGLRFRKLWLAWDAVASADGVFVVLDSKGQDPRILG